MSRLDGGAADIRPRQPAIHPPLLRQERGANHGIASLVLRWQPLLESGQPAADISLLLVDGEQHGNIAQYPRARLAHIDPHPAQIGHTFTVNQSGLHIDIRPQHGANIGTAIPATGDHGERQAAATALGQWRREIECHPLQGGVEAQLEAERLVIGQGQPQLATPVAAAVEDAV